MTGAASPWCQRWRHHQQTWRHASDGGFDASRYDVDELDESDGRRFLLAHHCAGASYPAALRRYGMTDRADGQLVGVVVLGAPASAKVLTSAFPTLEPYTQAVEASRIALVDQVPSNGETWLLARVFRRLREAGVRGVVSFADPMPRRTLTGQLVKAGHIGTIYFARAGAIYTGRGTPRTLTLLPDGSVLNARSAQKVRAQEQGHRYVQQRLVDLGAAPLQSGQVPPPGWPTPCRPSARAGSGTRATTAICSAWVPANATAVGSRSDSTRHPTGPASPISELIHRSPADHQPFQRFASPSRQGTFCSVRFAFRAQRLRTELPTRTGLRRLAGRCSQRCPAARRRGWEGFGQPIRRHVPGPGLRDAPEGVRGPGPPAIDSSR